MQDDWSPEHLGRFGGTVAVVMGGLVFAAGAVLLVRSWTAGIDGSGDVGFVVPVGALMGGLMLVGTGLWGIRSAPREVEPAMSLPAARQELQTRPLPFWVCVRCRAFVDRSLMGECLECGRRADYLEVASEDDRRTALSALGS